jgi:hypothetical protein
VPELDTAQHGQHRGHANVRRRDATRILYCPEQWVSRRLSCTSAAFRRNDSRRSVRGRQHGTDNRFWASGNHRCRT